jgi:hypothetical protein
MPQADTKPMLGKRRWLSILLIATLATVGLGVAAGADSATEADFVAHINASRSAQGLAPLAVDSKLVGHARDHTAAMVAAGDIFHSSSAQLQSYGKPGWQKIGENVGKGGAVDSLHNAFMNSAGHRKNILGDYNYVGVGTDTSNGVLYVTVIFMKLGSSSTTTTTPGGTDTTQAPTTTQPKQTQPKPTTTTQPKPTTTTTTLPPTTTTTLIVGPDKPVTPGESCLSVSRLWWTCRD